MQYVHGSEKRPLFQSLIPYYLDGAVQAFDQAVIQQMLENKIDIMIKKKVDIGGASYIRITDAEHYIYTAYDIPQILGQISHIYGTSNEDT